MLMQGVSNNPQYQTLLKLVQSSLCERAINKQTAIFTKFKLYNISLTYYLIPATTC